jgi:hypothetical protein
MAHAWITLSPAMLSDLQQKRVWEGWLSAEIRANYFADLSGRYHRRQRLTTWAILVCSSGAAGALVAGLPSHYAWAAPALSLLTAGLSGYALAVQHQKSAVDAADLHFRWNSLANAYARLWDDVYSAEAPATLTTLESTGAELSKAGTAFPVLVRRLLKWQEHVERHHAQAIHASTA